jgi:hypothetical protein
MLSAEEVQINNKLVQRGFVHRTRMPRSSAPKRLPAHVGEYRSDPRGPGSASAICDAHPQARAQYQSQATDEPGMHGAAARRALRPSQDQVERNRPPRSMAS